MGFLNPLFLAAGTVALIPIVLHLFYRQESKIFTFPAIRYLLRTERQHARQIRTQQILLLLLRVAIVLVVAILGARIYFAGPGGSHDPTALALVIDNSMSATIVEDGRRRLDTLKAVARQSVAAAGHEDLIWVVRAGTPWEPAVPGGIEQALAAIQETGPAHGPGDLTRAVERARALAGQSDLPDREVHVFTDLQATGFSESQPLADDVPVVVFAAPVPDAQNRGIASVSFGGGLAPLAGRRTEIAVSVVGHGVADTVGVRLYIDGQVRAAGRVPVGASARLPAGPFPAGRVQGYVEIDPDRLTADDRRYFTFSVRDPTPVAVLGQPSFFLQEALGVLEESDRIVLGAPGRAATLVSVGGDGLDDRGLDQSAVVAPGADAARLPAFNRRLAGAGIPYRYEAAAPGGARIATNDLGIDLDDLEIRRFFRMASTATGAPSQSEVVIALSSGDPWLVAGTSPRGSYVLLASPLDEASTSLPVSAAMIPVLERIIDRWSAQTDGGGAVTAGSNFRPPPIASSVTSPDGTEHPVDGDQPFLATTVAGFYRPMARDSALQVVAVNAPPAETDLTPATPSGVSGAIPGTVTIVDDAASWSREIFRQGRGPEPWRPLAAILLLLLVVETTVAAARGLRSRGVPGDAPDDGKRRGPSGRPGSGRVSDNPAVRV